MPEITIYGWKCDICGKEFFEKDSSYNNQYRVSIEQKSAPQSPCFSYGVKERK